MTYNVFGGTLSLTQSIVSKMTDKVLSGIFNFVVTITVTIIISVMKCHHTIIIVTLCLSRPV